MDAGTASLQITVGDVAKWRQTLAENRATIGRLSDENARLERQIEAARILAPQLFGQGAEAGYRLSAETVTTWAELVLYALAHAKGGITQADMLEEGRSTAMASRIANSPNGLYGAVAKLASRGDIVRKGDLFYLPDTWAAVESGQLPESRPPKAKRSLADEIEDIATDGVARQPKDIFAKIESEEARNRLRATQFTYGYTVLSRLVEKGLLVKQDGFYKAVKKEAPNGNTAGASLAGEAPTSPDDTPPLFRVVK